MNELSFIQTLYISKSGNPYKECFGWAAPEYHLMSWALSCLQLQSIYGEVHLYCNSPAAYLLCEKLGLPYSQVKITHDTLQLPDDRLWALPKIFTYSLQDKPFLHLDGDVFLFKELPSNLLSKELIAQNIESATDYYLQTQKELETSFTYFPDCVITDFKSNTPIRAVNAGILGGSNICFIKEYATLAFKYVNRNINHLDSINVDRFNVFFEQHLFYSLAQKGKLDIGVLITGTINDNQYLYLGNFHETPCNRSYLHLLGHYKKDELTCRMMASKLRELHPEYYYKIIKLLKDKTRLSISFLYNEINYSSETLYKEFADKAVKNFNSHSRYRFTNKHTTKETKSSIHAALHSLVNDIKDNEYLFKQNAEADLKVFFNSISSIKNEYQKIPKEYIYGRDLDSVTWYCRLFGNKTHTMAKEIEKCKGVNIIQSEFNWSGLYNKNIRVAVRYYDDLQILRGEFYNLVLPEIYGDGYSLYDIDEMEYLILTHLQSQMNIGGLFNIMLEYADDDVIQNHIARYETLFIEMLKQLVLKKAIKPLKE